MKSIAIDNTDKDYQLRLAETETPRPGPNEVLIRVAAAGLNHADMLQARGAYPPPPGASPVLGMEVSGAIEAIGEKVNSVKSGDPVCALLPGGGYAEYAVASESCLLPVPKGVSLVHAAALPEAYFTVWTNLMDSARLKAGETVLIHGGSSGIGTAAIQLCAARGHKVFTTAGSEEKLAACRALGAHRAINYRTEDFVAVIKDETAKRGVDVMLDMVGGDYLQKNISVAAVWGRIVNIAYQAGMNATINCAPMLMKRLSLMATTLRSRSDAEKGAIRDALLAEVWPLIDVDKIKPVVDSTFPLADAQTAHARMAESKHIGKILLAV
jgi:putative PIG3 family NAD(P)H quinone oxidoreductase